MIVRDESSAFTDDFQDFLMQTEDESWWFKYRAEVIIGLMERFFSRSIKTTDIGGGNGYTSAMAGSNGFAMELLEPSEGACNNAKRRGLVVHNGMMTSQYPKDYSYDQVMLLDVLEHIEDDSGFLKLLNRKMSDDGLGIVTVPAFMCLWSNEDDSAGHFRRYRLNELCELMKGIGFEVIYRSYFFSFLFVPILLVRVIGEKIGLVKYKHDCSYAEQKRILNSQLKLNGVIVGFALDVLESLETRLMKHQNRVPFGSSIIIVIKKCFVLDAIQKKAKHGDRL